MEATIVIRKISGEVVSVIIFPRDDPEERKQDIAISTLASLENYSMIEPMDVGDRFVAEINNGAGPDYEVAKILRQDRSEDIIVW